LKSKRLIIINTRGKKGMMSQAGETVPYEYFKTIGFTALREAKAPLLKGSM
jgi:hypothetical protein